MSSKRTCASFELQLTPIEGNDLTLNDLARALALVGSIYDKVKQATDSNSDVTSLQVLHISMSSPTILELLGIKDIVEAVLSLLEVPWRLRQKSLETKKISEEIENIKAEHANLEIGHRLAQQEIEILESKRTQESIKTLELAHECYAEVMRTLADFVREHPNYAEALVPVSFRVANEIIELTHLPLRLTTHNVTIIEGEYRKASPE